MSLFNQPTTKKIFGEKVLVFNGEIIDETGAKKATIARIGHTLGNIQVANRFLKLSPARQLYLITTLKQLLKLHGRNDLSYFEKHVLADGLGFRKMMQKYPNTKKEPFLKFLKKELHAGPKDLSSYRIKNFINK